jgi:hypothetical protein
MIKSLTRRLALACAIVSLVALCAASPAGAAPLTLTVAPSPITPGGTFTIFGSADCITGTTLTVSVVGAGLSTSVSGDASWDISFTTTSTVPTGTFPITVTGNECSYPAASITIEPLATTTTSSTTTSTTTAPTTTKPTTTAKAAAAAVTASPSFTG